ncbi:uncharacterized protein N0V89_004282 [Didymosphaeria variabile]|uniref:Uncharacterized protein n=1 Tax=Didymosphaeria variabile TaxID=1932322 RepID=A0A9W8XQV9_9PLEO|nr:uncharacterized protein N0V89_004282 [Didymosphaeria variabile]KAJ4356251.1 hypothetical protein N0V89_004282 [Didymosphaeria variabile]
MSSTMDKLKDKLHIRRKSQSEDTGLSAGQSHAAHVQRESFDEELAAVPPEEREAYLKEFEDADRTGESKKGGLIDKLIARGNKRTEDQLAQEQNERSALASAPKDGVIR